MKSLDTVERPKKICIVFQDDIDDISADGVVPLTGNSAPIVIPIAHHSGHPRLDWFYPTDEFQSGTYPWHELFAAHNYSEGSNQRHSVLRRRKGRAGQATQFKEVYSVTTGIKASENI